MKKAKQAESKEIEVSKQPEPIKEKFAAERYMARAVRGKTIGYISAALGLVAGLAWNDAVKSLIESVFPPGGNTLTAKFLYAGIITAIIAIVISYLEGFQEQK